MDLHARRLCKDNASDRAAKTPFLGSAVASARRFARVTRFRRLRRYGTRQFLASRACDRIAAWARKGAFKDRPLWRRLQTIHHQIKDGRRPNASSLARELRVSSKTVQRDLDYLRDELEAPIEFDRGENGYAYSRSDYVLPFLPVDGKDLFSIGVAAQVLALFGGTPLARDLEACYERLAELMPPAVRLRPEIVREKIALRSAAPLPARPRGDLAGRGRGHAARRRAVDPVPPPRRAAGRAAHRASVRDRALGTRLAGGRATTSRRAR